MLRDRNDEPLWTYGKKKATITTKRNHIAQNENMLWIGSLSPYHMHLMKYSNGEINCWDSQHSASITLARKYDPSIIPGDLQCLIVKATHAQGGAGKVKLLTLIVMSDLARFIIRQQICLFQRDEVLLKLDTEQSPKRVCQTRATWRQHQGLLKKKILEYRHQTRLRGSLISIPYLPSVRGVWSNSRFDRDSSPESQQMPPFISGQVRHRRISSSRNCICQQEGFIFTLCWTRRLDIVNVCLWGRAGQR